VSEMVQPRPCEGHEALHRAVVGRIAAELRPVRRLWPIGVRLTLWILLETGVLITLLGHGYRTDLAGKLRDPWYLLGVGGFAGAGILAAAYALRASIPGREPRRIEAFLLLFLAAASALLLFHEPVEEHIQLAKFISMGAPCATRIAIYAAIPWVALVWAVKRAAPLDAAAEGSLAGASALLISFALMRVSCPADDRLHLLVWHFLPALLGIAISACIGMVLLKRRASKLSGN